MKSIFAASSILILSIASFFTQSTMNITFDAPTQVSAGQSFILNIEVDKGDISNFAKLQLNFPEGFNAELLDGKGGTFTFYDQKMKLIWISLPSDSKFNIKVKINTDNSLSGDFSFNGKVSYVNGDGERSGQDIVTPKINVSPNANKDAQTAASGTTGVGVKPQNTGSAELRATRSFDATQVAPGETFLVEIKIDKSNVSGVGKIIENIPKGFTAQEVNANGAIFSQKENQVKFLWMTLPAEDEFTVSYKIAVDAGLNGNKVIDGKMSYLDGSDTRFALIEGTSVEITDSPSAPENDDSDVATDQGGNDSDNDTSDDTQTADDGQDNMTADTNGGDEPESNDDNDEGSNDSDIDNGNSDSDGNSDNDASSDITQPENPNADDNGNDITPDHQVNYRVQICALKTQVPTSYFVQNHNVNEHIYLNQHENWNKYTVGDFGKYMKAQAHREVAKNNYKIKGPFVTAYNNGTRITVQEALMITKDEWVAPK